uniref:TBC1 domain family member 2 n=1 Tax=Sphenodon punctatus TaxID=8508 RepID=A0A8D0GYP4_SPHPU
MEKEFDNGNCPQAGMSSKLEESNLDPSRNSIHPAEEKDMTSFPGDLENNGQFKAGKDAHRKKLCGYLNKFSAKGRIKAWKSRWFSYDEQKCHLAYYRTAQDINPLGNIDISTASFDCKVGEDERVFEIRTPSKAYILKAVSTQAMMYWLQQLQIKRWEFCNSQPGLPVASIIVSALSGYEPLPDCTEAEEEELMPTVKTPTTLVGVKAASLPAPQAFTALQNISLKHPWIEIQNTVHNLCGGRQSHGNGGNMFDFDEFQEPPENFVEEEQLEAENAVEEETQEETRTGFRSGLVRKAKKLNSSFPRFAEGLAQEKVGVLQQHVLTLTEEVKCQKELVKLLHKALEAAQQEKRESCRYLAAAEDKDRLELVRHKVRQIAELSRRVETLELERKELGQSLAVKEAHIKELAEHVQLLMDKNQAKQQVILKLTEQTAGDFPDSVTEADVIATETLYKQQEEIEHLKDDIKAYKTQNQFLNAEIHQVTKIWTKVAEKEKALLMKCTRLQAYNCQMESKYLMMLRELQELPDLPSDHVEIVKRLIQEALQWDVKNGAMDPAHPNLVSEYDAYGFMSVPEYEVEDWKLLAKIQALETKTNILLSQEAVERPLLERWNSLGELAPSTELKGLLRCGIPVEHRPRVWRWIVNCRVHHLRSAGHYQRLLGKREATKHPASRQIELDLPRTLTSNRHFASPTSPFIARLRRVLLAFYWQNPTIGYCQGLNRLAAIALLVLEEEESAFWCLVHIVENLMPVDYYSNTLVASQVDQRVFKDFLAEKLPRLMAHLEQHAIDLALITFNWFLVVFVDSLASDILFRVWDAFLYEGTKVIFRYALAIFKYNEEEILRLQDSLEIYQYLRFFSKTISDGRKLMNIAFSDMNPFPMKLLQNRRVIHREKLEAELRELERIKAQYMREQVEQGAGLLDGAVSEDEEEG